MNGKILLMGFMIILLCSSATVVFAKYVYSFNYVECDVLEASKTTKTLDKTYEQFIVKVNNQLTYNATTATALKIQLHNADNTDNLTMIMYDNGYFDLWFNGATNYKICGLSSGAWEAGKPLTVSLAGSYIQVQLSNGTYLIQDYAIGTFNINKVSAFALADDAFTGGYVTVEVEENLAGGITTNLLDQILPIFVIAITLGLLGKALSKVQRKV